MTNQPEEQSTQLSTLLAKGAIKRPDGPGSVHLFRALSSLCGYDSFEESDHHRRLKRAIGEYTHYVFVLIDGMGSSLTGLIPEDGWFARARRETLSSVYPSTTAVALTSQATGLWPAEHGVTGWHTYLPGRKLTVLPLKASERFTGKALKAFDIPFREVVQPESISSASPTSALV